MSYGGGLVIACRRGDLSHGLRLADNRQGENEKGGDFQRDDRERPVRRAQRHLPGPRRLDRRLQDRRVGHRLRRTDPLQALTPASR